MAGPLQAPVFNLDVTIYSDLAERRVFLDYIGRLLLIQVQIRPEGALFDFFYNVLMVLNLSFAHIDIIDTILPLHVPVVKAVGTFNRGTRCNRSTRSLIHGYLLLPSQSLAIQLDR